MVSDGLIVFKRPSEKGLGKFAAEAHGAGFCAAGHAAEVGRKVRGATLLVRAQVDAFDFAGVPFGFVD